MALLLILLAVVAAVIAIPLVAVARRGQRPGANSPVLVITYLILVVASIVATSAFSSLVESILPGQREILDEPSDLALTLSTLIVAGLVWGSVWIAFERRRTGSSTARNLYLALTASVALTVVAYGAVRLIAFALGVDEFMPAVAADVISFGALWALMIRWRGADRELDEIRLFWGSVVGLGLAVAGVGFLLTISLQALVGERQILIGENGWFEGLRWGLAILVVVAVYFTMFWLRGFALRTSPFRNGYAAAVSVVAWFSSLFALVFVAHSTLEWVLGLGEDGFARQFRSLPAGLSTLIAGGLAYWHHRAYLGRERTETVRAIEYIFGASGLAFFAGNFSFLVTILLLRYFGSDPVLASDSSTLLGTLVGLAVSGGATIRYWGRALQLEEPKSPSRRVALLVLFFASAFTGAIALIFVLFTLLRSVLAGGGEELADPLSWAVPITVIASVLCWHVVELRRRLQPQVAIADEASPGVDAPQAAGKVDSGRIDSGKIVTVAASDPGPLPSLIEGMRFLRRADGVGVVSAEAAPEIVAAINAAEGRAVLVTVGTEGFTVVPLA